jgi:hypothetical protein
MCCRKQPFLIGKIKVVSDHSANGNALPCFQKLSEIAKHRTVRLADCGKQSKCPGVRHVAGFGLCGFADLGCPVPPPVARKPVFL